MRPFSGATASLARRVGCRRGAPRSIDRVRLDERVREQLARPGAPRRRAPRSRRPRRRSARRGGRRGRRCTPSIPRCPRLPSTARPCGIEDAGLRGDVDGEAVACSSGDDVLREIAREAGAGDPLVRLDVARDVPATTSSGSSGPGAVLSQAGPRASRARTACRSWPGRARARTSAASQNRDESGVSASSMRSSVAGRRDRARTRTSCRRAGSRPARHVRPRPCTARRAMRPRPAPASSPPDHRRPSSSKSMFSSCSPCSALVAGVKIGAGSRSLSRSPAGSAHAADGAVLAVLLPARAREVATDDGLDRDDVGRAADHHAAAERLAGPRPAGSGSATAGGSARSTASRRTRTATGRSAPGPCPGSASAGRRRTR